VGKNEVELADYLEPIANRRVLLDDFNKSWQSYTQNLVIAQTSSSEELLQKKTKDRDVLNIIESLLAKLKNPFMPVFGKYGMTVSPLLLKVVTA